MRSILISVKPKWVAKILNGEKTIEIRKTMPKCDLPIDVYIYCTKEDSLGRIKELPKDRYFVDCVETPQDFAKMDSGYDGKGKVVAKFTLNKVELIRPIALGSFLKTSTLENKEILDKSCLTENEIRRYLTNMYGYAWHISNLEIFDRPKELSEFDLAKCIVHRTFKSHDKECKLCKHLTKAPQSWCYVEIGE